MICEWPEWFHVARPKARKQHKCCECRGVIDAGETHLKYSGVWGGEFASHRMCLDCRALMNEVDAGVPVDEQCGFTGLLECCADIGDEYLSRLVSIMAKRRAKIPDWAAERLADAKEETR